MTSDKERKRRSRARQKKIGWNQLNVIIHDEDRPKVIAYVKELTTRRRENEILSRNGDHKKR